MIEAEAIGASITRNINALHDCSGGPEAASDINDLRILRSIDRILADAEPHQGLADFALHGAQRELDQPPPVIRDRPDGVRMRSLEL
jgi:hypothetical protein